MVALSGWNPNLDDFKGLTIKILQCTQYTLYIVTKGLKYKHSFFKYAIHSNFFILFNFLKVVTATTKLFSFTTSESPSGVEQH